MHSRTAVTRVFLSAIVVACVLLVACSKASGADDDACLFCHSKISAGLVKQWRKSTHATSYVGCLACHGAEQSEPDSWIHGQQWISSIVTPKDCAECHEKEYVEFSVSRHSTAGLILHSKDNRLGEFVGASPMDHCKHVETRPSDAGPAGGMMKFYCSGSQGVARIGI